MAFVFVGLTSAQEIYYSEDFEAGLPADWTADGEWAAGTSSSLMSQYFSFAGNDGTFVGFNDDGAGGSHVGGGRVVSGAIDLTTVTGSLWIEMNTYFLNGDYQGNDETFKLSISTDDGATFTELADFGNVLWGYEVIKADDYAGQTVRLAFDYDDGATWNFGAGFDDVSFVSEPINAVRKSYFLTANGSNVMTECIENLDYQVEGIFMNGGYEAVTSFDVTVTSGGQMIATQTFDGMSLAKGQGIKYTMSESLNTGETTATYNVSVSNVNGEMVEDENTADNAVDFAFMPIEVHPDKAAVVEEATGTWCQWCPRGTVFLDEMSKRFGKNFVGIAVHNSDPMVLPEYDNSIVVGGYPSAIFNRTNEIDPGAIKTPSIASMKLAPAATIEIGGTMDGAAFTSTVRVDFTEAVSGANYNVAVVLTEDDLTGDDAAWNQVNAYSGGGNGPMGGFELLSGSVPSQLFPYSHVGRALIGGFSGVDAINGDFTANQGKNTELPAFSIPAEWNTDKMHVVALLLDASGRVLNAKSVSFDDAIANGPTKTVEIVDESLALAYPNPASDYTNLTINVATSANVKVDVIDLMGKSVDRISLGKITGQQTVPVDVSGYPVGTYVFKVIAGDRVNSQKVTIVR